MITCSNCGYENNSDDALSCSLCGKVFRKEVREDKEERKSYESKKKFQIYWDRRKTGELIGLILLTVFCLTMAIITGIEWEPLSLIEFLSLIFGMGILSLAIWGWLIQSPKDRERDDKWERESVLHPFKSTIKVLKSKGREKIEAITFLCSFIIAWIIYEMFLTKRFPKLKKALEVEGTASCFEGIVILVIAISIAIIFLKIYDLYQKIIKKGRRDKK